MARRAIQRNNQSPMGYGQPGRGSGERDMSNVLLREEDQQVFGQGQPPHVYPQPPTGQYGNPYGRPELPQGQPPQGGTASNVVGRSPYGGWGQGSPQLDPATNQYRTQPVGRPEALDQSGQNSYAQYAYRNTGPAADANVAQQRNTLATPISDAQARLNWQRMYPTVPYPGPTGDPYTGQVLGGRDLSGFDSASAQQQWAQYYPGTPYPGDQMVQQYFGAPGSGYGFGGVDNPQYQGPGAQTGPHSQPGAPSGTNLTALQQAVAQSMQNGYTDIAGMREYFKPGQFQGQLTGFNTGGWGTGERGTDTLKNMMGTIFSNFDVTQQGALNNALPEIRKALPNATIVEHANQDLLDPDGPNGPMAPVDVIRNATAGGAGDAWAWQPTDQGGGGGMTGGPGGPAQQAYLSAFPGQQPGQGMAQPGMGMPEVSDQNSAMQFLQWLLQQQQQGQMPQYGGQSPVGF